MNLPVIDSELEKNKITSFINSTLHRVGFKNLVIGVSGGIDSATSLYLASKVIKPENIFIAHLYYFQSLQDLIKPMIKALKIPTQNQYLLSIKKPIDELKNLVNLPTTYNLQPENKIRLGNIMARVRMITLFDLAKKHQALVLGTENKSENLLGYFTRFGDAASDIEPITHLYKTQIYQLAKYLGVPQEILKAKPSAGLWNNQTDEAEFGFSYQEADLVLHQYFDNKIPLTKIASSVILSGAKNLANKVSVKQFPNAEKIVNFALRNSFKNKVPYFLK